MGTEAYRFPREEGTQDHAQSRDGKKAGQNLATEEVWREAVKMPMGKRTMGVRTEARWRESSPKRIYGNHNKEESWKQFCIPCSEGTPGDIMRSLTYRHIAGVSRGLSSIVVG